MTIDVHYDEQQLDALRELASIGAGTAATALSQMLGRPVELAVPRALALPLADAVEAVGAPETLVSAAVMEVDGDVEAVVLLLFPEADAATLCELLGVEHRTMIGDSALGEIANVLGAAALGALAKLTKLAVEPRPPQVLHDMLGAIVASALAQTVGDVDLALVLDASLTLAGVPSGLSFLLLPSAGGVAELLTRLGLGR